MKPSAHERGAQEVFAATKFIVTIKVLTGESRHPNGPLGDVWGTRKA